MAMYIETFDFSGKIEIKADRAIQCDGSYTRAGDAFLNLKSHRLDIGACTEISRTRGAGISLRAGI